MNILNIEHKIILTPKRAISAFIALGNKVNVLCQVNEKDFKSVFSKINDSFSEVESYIKFEDLKFTEKSNEYINSIFGHKNILVTDGLVIVNIYGRIPKSGLRERS